MSEAWVCAPCANVDVCARVRAWHMCVRVRVCQVCMCLIVQVFVNKIKLTHDFDNFILIS